MAHTTNIEAKNNININVKVILTYLEDSIGSVCGLVGRTPGWYAVSV